MEEKPKILVVDDEEINLALMEAMLAPAGYQVLVAVDGGTTSSDVPTNTSII